MAKSDVSNNLPDHLCRKVITIDMGQNLGLPNFEGKQPGDTYYFSPLTVLLFGIVDNATRDGYERMDAYVWREQDGDRGANNICSCLWKYFHMRGWLKKNYSDLCIVADNCGGQNKNRIVVRFLMWLVEMGYFPRIRLIFLVKGHTKNSCDRLFNLLKLSYHRKNVYTYDTLVEIINNNKFITAHKIESTEMYDFLKWQDIFYRTPEKEFKSTHIFEFSGATYGSTATLMKKWDYDGAELRTDSLLPTRRNKKCWFMPPEERKIAISTMGDDLDVLTRPELRDIKAVELYTKWRPLLPEWARDSTCPKPSEKVLEKVRASKSSKSKQLIEKKRKLEEEEEDDDDAV